MHSFIFRKLIFLLWFGRMLRRRIRQCIECPFSVVLRQYEGLPTAIEKLGAERKYVIRVMSPLSLAREFMYSPQERRLRLMRRIKNLPDNKHVYAFHYWMRSGSKAIIVTNSPSRGLQPPPAPSKGPCPSKVISAYQAGVDITSVVSPISASFHPSEKRISSHELFSYVLSVTKKPVDYMRRNPIMIMDATLEETCYEYL